MFGIEINNTHKVEKIKLAKIKEMCNDIIVYEVDANYIDDNIIAEINYKFKITT